MRVQPEIMPSITMSPIQSIDLPKLGEASIARRRSSALAGIHLRNVVK
ncbi:hypothetical protein MFRU_010g00090 [Monilinia fructicola]|nr:hypothetical protein MFRU_010g00090 [Monilinia fructicola]